MEHTQQSRALQEKLVEDIKAVIQDAEDLLKHGQAESSEAYQQAREKFEATLDNAKARIRNLESSMFARTREAVVATNEYVKTHPWQSLGAGTAIGLILGMLLIRR